MAHRHYEGDGITVHWDSDRCIYSHLCVLGAPSVFDHEARPWVNVSRGSADEIARVIDTCPSGALSYTRTDGAPNGRRGHAMDEDPGPSIRSDDESGPGELRPVVLAPQSELPTITPLPNGPLLVSGRFGLSRGDESVEVVDRVTLCRCGQSRSKPHCDGSHARVGFVAAGWAPSDAEQHVVLRVENRPERETTGEPNNLSPEVRGA